MFLGAIFFAILLALITGRNLMSIRYLPLKFSEIFIAAFFIRALCEYTGLLGKYVPYVFIFSYMLLFVGVILNVRLREMILIGFGFFLNFLVIAFNGGSMPVSLDALGPKAHDIFLQAEQTQRVLTHSILTSETPLWFLADIIPIPLPFIRYVASVGDIFISVGIFLFVYLNMKQKSAQN